MYTEQYREYAYWFYRKGLITENYRDVLQPVFDRIQWRHWYSIYVFHFTFVVFEHKYHVKILQMKL